MSVRLSGMAKIRCSDATTWNTSGRRRLAVVAASEQRSAARECQAKSRKTARFAAVPWALGREQVGEPALVKGGGRLGDPGGAPAAQALLGTPRPTSVPQARPSRCSATNDVRCQHCDLSDGVGVVAERHAQRDGQLERQRHRHGDVLVRHRVVVVEVQLAPARGLLAARPGRRRVVVGEKVVPAARRRTGAGGAVG